MNKTGRKKSSTFSAFWYEKNSLEWLTASFTKRLKTKKKGEKIQKEIESKNNQPAAIPTLCGQAEEFTLSPSPSTHMLTSFFIATSKAELGAKKPQSPAQNLKSHPSNYIKLF